MILGIDPGFTNTGIAVVGSTPAQRLKLFFLDLVTTEMPKKVRGVKRPRMTVIDGDRVRLVWTNIVAAMDTFKPDVVVVEAYAPYQGVANNAWKTALVYSAVLTTCWARSIPVHVARADDLRRHFYPPKKKGEKVGKASKTETEKYVGARLPGLVRKLDTWKKTQREHMSDAAAHAVRLSDILAEEKEEEG